MLNPTPLHGLHFCDVKVAVSHPGLNDTTHISVGLPFSGWHARFQGQGGGAFATEILGIDGKLFGLAPIVSGRFAATSTDGGHIQNADDPSSVQLDDESEVNWDLLVSFASRSPHDMTVVGKAVTEAF